MSEQEPVDYRFTLANERTFLAWLRTALALLAGAVAVSQLVPALQETWWATAFGVLLALSGTGVAVLALRRWRQVDAAMRRGVELPSSAVPVVLAGIVVVVGLAVAVLALLP